MRANSFADRVDAVLDASVLTPVGVANPDEADMLTSREAVFVKAIVSDAGSRLWPASAQRVGRCEPVAPQIRPAKSSSRATKISSGNQRPALAPKLPLSSIA